MKIPKKNEFLNSYDFYAGNSIQTHDGDVDDSQSNLRHNGQFLPVSDASNSVSNCNCWFVSRSCNVCISGLSLSVISKISVTLTWQRKSFINCVAQVLLFGLFLRYLLCYFHPCSSMHKRLHALMLQSECDRMCRNPPYHRHDFRWPQSV